MRTIDRMAVALIALGAMFLVLLFIVAGNDEGASTEVALLESTSVSTPASASECDAMYHAIWRVKQEPSHSTLIDIAKGLDCPFSE